MKKSEGSSRCRPRKARPLEKARRRGKWYGRGAAFRGGASLCKPEKECRAVLYLVSGEKSHFPVTWWGGSVPVRREYSGEYKRVHNPIWEMGWTSLGKITSGIKRKEFGSMKQGNAEKPWGHKGGRPLFLEKPAPRPRVVYRGEGRPTS